jgi:isoleucyl-tRNA synthetase
LIGVHVLKFGNDFVLKMLESRNELAYQEEITHSYPHCWRSGTPVIFRATNQWYMDLDALRPAAIAAVEETEFIPPSAKNRLMGMVKDRPDWCLSRQRAWGIPLAFLRHKKTGKVWFFEDILGLTSAHLSNSMDRWWENPIEDFLPEHYKYKPEDFEKVTDILDVWFDSGLTHQFLDSTRTRGADVVCEGSDQHRGWFQSSLWLGLAIGKEAPFKKIISHGFVVDEKGEKMAKSKGNVVSPQKVLEQYGAEVLRYWVATTDYTREMSLSDSILKRSAEGYRKLRNTLRFMVANLDDRLTESLDNDKPLEKAPEDLMPVDLWILQKASSVFGEIHRLYGEYDFCRGTHMLNDFIHAELSGIWMSAAKDRLYCGAKDSRERESAQHTLYQLLRSMLGLIAPLFTYTVSEVLGYCDDWFQRDLAGSRPGSGGTGDVFDIVYHPIPLLAAEGIDDNYWREALDKFNVAFDTLKQEKVVKDKMEVRVESSGKTFDGAEDWFGASSCMGVLDCLDYDLGSDQESLAVFKVGEDDFRIVMSTKGKCPRCWKRNVGQGPLCFRCKCHEQA